LSSVRLMIALGGKRERGVWKEKILCNPPLDGSGPLEEWVESACEECRKMKLREMVVKRKAPTITIRGVRMMLKGIGTLWRRSSALQAARCTNLVHAN
jgi:hypothetical protein